MDIPLLKYFFSTQVTTTSDAAVIMLLTPRDPAFWAEENDKATADFVALRRAFIQARHGSEEDLRLFKERHPNWGHMAPNRFGSHVFLMEATETYRALSGQDLIATDVDLQPLGPKAKD